MKKERVLCLKNYYINWAMILNGYYIKRGPLYYNIEYVYIVFIFQILE